MMAAKKLKDLVKERRMPVIAHHSTWLGSDPHDINAGSSIHAGTKKAAIDRLSDSLDITIKNSGYEPGDRLDAYMHTYEIPRSVINPVIHDDPDSWHQVLRHSASSRKRLKRAPEAIYEDSSGPGQKSNQVVAYKNKFEDKGSTSYVIPSNLVHSGRVKHLGQQFIESHVIED